MFHSLPKTLIAWLLCGSITVCATGFASADVFEFKDGRRITGKLLAKREAEKQLVIELDTGIALLINQKDLKQPPTVAKAEEEYAKEIARAPDTVEAHLAIAGWCDKSGLKSQRKAHYERVLELDPDHKVARAALGYRQDRGQWVRVETVMGDQRGKVKTKGKWQFPEVVAIEEERAATKTALDTLTKEVRTWNDDVMNSNRRAVESLEKIRNLNSPLAVAAVRNVLFPNGMQRLTKNLPPEALRLVYVELFGKLKSPDAAQTLIQLSMTDPDAQVRAACYEALRGFARRQATVTYIPYLLSDNTEEIELAATGIAEMRDETAVLPLIQSLVTSHKRTTTSGSGSMAPAFTSDSSGGNGGFSFNGNKPVTVEVPYNCQASLSALTLITGANFQYDESAWMDWYASKYFRSAADLRRDP